MCEIWGDVLVAIDRPELVDGSSERGFTLPGQVTCSVFEQCDQCEDAPERRGLSQDHLEVQVTEREWCERWRRFCATGIASESQI